MSLAFDLPAGRRRSDMDVVVVGAGPAGLTAAYLLSKQSRRVVVLEADDEYVGGLSRTVVYQGFRFDIGGHRFFSKSQEIEDLWTELLGDDMLERPRSSRIHYAGHFFAYPIRPLEILQRLGVLEATRCVLCTTAQLLADRDACSLLSAVRAAETDTTTSIATRTASIERDAARLTPDAPGLPLRGGNLRIASMASIDDACRALISVQDADGRLRIGLAPY